LIRLLDDLIDKQLVESFAIGLLMFKTGKKIKTSMCARCTFQNPMRKQQRVLIASKRERVNKRTKTSGTPVPLPVITK
jgi:hypothetical protein